MSYAAALLLAMAVPGAAGDPPPATAPNPEQALPMATPVLPPVLPFSCPPLAVGTADQPILLLTHPLGSLPGAVIELRVPTSAVPADIEHVSHVRIGNSYFGGGQIIVVASISKLAIRLAVDSTLFADLEAAGAIRLIAADGAAVDIALDRAALAPAAACIAANAEKSMDGAVPARIWRSRGVLLRLAVNQAPKLRHSFPLDYPPGPLRRGASATTLVRLVISPAGRVASCAVDRSSGDAELDTAACTQIWKLRFSPATDAAGKPVAAEAVQTLRWQFDQ